MYISKNVTEGTVCLAAKNLTPKILNQVFITKRPTNNKKGAISAFCHISYLFGFGVLIDLHSSISTASLKTSLTVGWA